MEKERDAKEYSSRWVGANEVLSSTSCDLLYAKFTPDAAAGGCTLYSGKSAIDPVIVELLMAAGFSEVFNPPKPVYCPRGLFVGAFITGDVFVQWRVRKSEEG